MSIVQLFASAYAKASEQFSKKVDRIELENRERIKRKEVYLADIDPIHASRRKSDH